MRGRNTGFVIGAVVLIAIIRAAAGGLFSNSSVTLPPTLRGEPQITTGQPADDAARIESEMSGSGVHGGDGAAYGTGTEASYYVFVAPGEDEDAQALYAAFSSGVVKAGGTMGTSSTETVGGVSLVCSDFLNGSTPVGSVCTWAQGNSGVIYTHTPDVKGTAAAGAEIWGAV